MDWATHDHAGARRPATAAPVVVATHWRVVGPSHKPLTCVTVRDVIGLEVRVGYNDLDLLRSERVPSLEFGALLAAEWKSVVMAKGGFTDLHLTN